MNHKFNTKAAQSVGVQPAVILWYFHAATEAAKALGDNFFNGRHWFRVSVSTLAKKYPYLSQQKIRYAIRKLVNDGYVVVGNYNEYSNDVTAWYALTEKGYELME